MIKFIQNDNEHYFSIISIDFIANRNPDHSQIRTGLRQLEPTGTNIMGIARRRQQCQNVITTAENANASTSISITSSNDNTNTPSQQPTDIWAVPAFIPAPSPPPPTTPQTVCSPLNALFSPVIHDHHQHYINDDDYLQLSLSLTLNSPTITDKS